MSRCEHKRGKKYIEEIIEFHDVEKGPDFSKAKKLIEGQDLVNQLLALILEKNFSGIKF